jgi:hypothetical protein
MRRLIFACVLAFAIGASTCAAKSASTKGTGLRKGTSPAQAKIILKRDPNNAAKCVARTIPHVLQVEFGVDDSVVFKVKQRAGARCLPNGVELELRWVKVGENPTACTTMGTAASGNKTEFDCDLDAYVPGGKYSYKLFRVGTSLPGGEEQVEDPDIEIVEF